MGFGSMDRNASEPASRVLWFAGLVLVALIFGLAFAHAMELPGKLRLDGPTWLTVQQNLYIGFGPLAAVVEPLGVAVTWLLAWRLWRRRGFAIAVAAALCVSVGLVEWALIVAPMNTRLNAWTTATLPADWTACRDQWEFGHILHAILFGAAFCLLASLSAGVMPTAGSRPIRCVTRAERE
jgi:hypothetical protein